MTVPTLGRLVFAGLPLLRRAPLSVLVWGVWLLPLSLLGGLLSGLYDGVGGVWAHAVPPLLRDWLQFGLLFTNMLTTCVGMAVLAAAVFRAVTDPDQTEGRWLRIGGDEIRLVLVWSLMLVTGLAMVFLIAIVIVALTRNSLLATSPAVLAAASAVAATVLARFALAPPMTLFEQRLALGDSWRLMRGRHGAAAVCALTFLVAYGSGEWLLSTLSDLLHRGAPDAKVGAGPPVPALVLYATRPENIVPHLASMVIGTVAGVIAYAPMAVLYRDLAGRTPADRAAVFD